MKIDLSPRFQELVHEQIDIITSAKNPEDAARWFDGLIERISILDTFPEAGRISRVPDLAAGYRRRAGEVRVDGISRKVRLRLALLPAPPVQPDLLTRGISFGKQKAAPTYLKSP